MVFICWNRLCINLHRQTLYQSILRLFSQLKGSLFNLQNVTTVCTCIIPTRPSGRLQMSLIEATKTKDSSFSPLGDKEEQLIRKAVKLEAAHIWLTELRIVLLCYNKAVGTKIHVEQSAVCWGVPWCCTGIPEMVLAFHWWAAWQSVCSSSLLCPYSMYVWCSCLNYYT